MEKVKGEMEGGACNMEIRTVSSWNTMTSLYLQR